MRKQYLIHNLLLALLAVGCTSTPSQPTSVTPLDTTYLHSFTRCDVVLSGAYLQSSHNKHQTDTILPVGFSTVINYGLPSKLVWSGDHVHGDTSRLWSSDPTPPTYRDDATRGSESFSFDDSLTASNTLSGRFSNAYSSWAKNHWGNVYVDENLSSSVQFHDLPILIQHPDTLIFSASGAQLRGLLGSASYSRTTQASDPDFAFTRSLTEFSWDSSRAPTLTIRFTR
jgi:hypothetical protein